MGLEHNYDLLRFDGKLKWHDRLCAVAYVSLCFDADCCTKTFSTTGFCRAVWPTETPRKAEVLCIDIVSLSNQIPLIFPSKASNFLGWEILEFLFQCSMFVFQMSQWCQVFLAEQLVLSACAAAWRFQAAWSHMEFSALCGFFSLLQLSIIPRKPLVFPIHTLAGIKWGIWAPDGTVVPSPLICWVSIVSAPVMAASEISI